jgi:2-methylcitrate dehydratase PrpD
MACIKVRADESLLADGYPKSWPAQVTVVTASGRHERRVRHVPGDPARALSENDLRQKFCRLATPILGEQLADEMYSRGLSALDRSPASLIRDIEQICEPFMKPRLEGIVR